MVEAEGLQLGTVIQGLYRIESLLGEGGFGAVYAATQLNLNRKVALKVLHSDVITRGAALQRFKREAELAQSLTHPNTVRLFDFGETSGHPYIIYELLDGRSLESVITEAGRLSARRTARIASQTLKALMEAHQRGIVHRDIKPGNLFICHFAGEPDFVKVLDFGIASARGSHVKGQTLTQEGTTVGTPAYMSPEQALALDLDGRADLYSVGLVMAEMLTGARVFSATASAMQIVVAQASDQPVPYPFEVLNSPLGEVIRRSTEKNRDLRWPNAGAMLQAIEQVLAMNSGSLDHIAMTYTPSNGQPAQGRVATPLQYSLGSQPQPTQLAHPGYQNTTPAQAIPSTPPAQSPQAQPWMHTTGPRGTEHITSAPTPNEIAPKPKRSKALVIVLAVLAVVIVGGASFGIWVWVTYSGALKSARRTHQKNPRHDGAPTGTDDFAGPTTPGYLPDALAAAFKVKGVKAAEVLDRAVKLKLNCVWSGGNSGLPGSMNDAYYDCLDQNLDTAAGLRLFCTEPGHALPSVGSQASLVLDGTTHCGVVVIGAGPTDSKLIAEELTGPTAPDPKK